MTSQLKYTVRPKIEQSPMEAEIAKRLIEKQAYFKQEVEFHGCINPTTGALLRFDFYLPGDKILIEYDGLEFHSAQNVKSRDLIKSRWAKENELKLFRIQGLAEVDLFFKNRFFCKASPKQLTKQKHRHKRNKPKTIPVQCQPQPAPVKKKTREEIIAAIERTKQITSTVDLAMPQGFVNKTTRSRPLDKWHKHPTYK